MRSYISTFSILIGLVAISPGTATAGEILKTSPGADFTWSSTTCFKPRTPTFNSQAQNPAGLMSQYTFKVDAYLACMKKEAQDDFDRAQFEMQQAIERELEKTVAQINEDVKRAASKR